MWIGRICIFGWLTAWFAGFFMDFNSHRNYVAFLERKLRKASKFLPHGKFTVRKLMKRSLRSTLRNK